jgi:IclR helix-turn-helix domain
VRRVNRLAGLSEQIHGVAEASVRSLGRGLEGVVVIEHSSAAGRAGTSRVRRPGGRNEQVRQSVAHAVLELLTTGDAELTVASIAAKAGVHRATVYRRWPTVGELLREALTVHTSALHIRDTGEWEWDVRRLWMT